MVPEIQGKKLSKFQIKSRSLESSKGCTIKKLLDSGDSVSIIHRDILNKRQQITKNKRTNGLPWQGCLIHPT